MREKDFQRMFGHWVKENPELIPSKAIAWELKIEKGKSFAFDKVAPHQIEALKEVKHFEFYHKIPDQPVSWGQDTKIRFTAKKPFDCFLLKKADAFIVIWFYEPRQKKTMYWIDIDHFLSARERADRKSLTKDQVISLAIYKFNFT